MVHRGVPRTPINRLRGRLGLEIESLALTLAAAVNAVIGLVYWAIAARGFDPTEVGRSSAIITSATMLATVANLSFGGMYERFLPVAGTATRRLLVRGVAVTTTLALLLGAGFLVVGPTDRLFDTDAEAAAFPVLVASLAAFALADHVLVGLHRATYAAGKNILHALSKLVLAAVAALVSASGFSLVLAWVGPALLLVLIYGPLIVGRWTATAAYRTEPRLPPRREMWHFFGATYGIVVVLSIPPLVVPLLVVRELGTETNAYFAVAWTLFSAVSILTSTLFGPYIAGASRPGAAVMDLTWRFVRLLVVLTLLGAVFVAFGAPRLLLLLGENYSTRSEDLLRLMGIALPLALPGLLYAAVARVVRRLRLAVAVQIASCLALVGGIAWSLERWGLAGIGWTYIVVEGIVCVTVTIPLTRMLRALGEREGLTA